MIPTLSNDPRGDAPYRALTPDECHAVAGGATRTSGGLAPDPHTPDIVTIIMALIKTLA